MQYGRYNRECATGVTPEWSDSEAPVEKVTGVYLYLPVAGSRPAFFHRYFFAPSLFNSGSFSKMKTFSMISAILFIYSTCVFTKIMSFTCN